MINMKTIKFNKPFDKKEIILNGVKYKATHELRVIDGKTVDKEWFNYKGYAYIRK